MTKSSFRSPRAAVAAGLAFAAVMAAGFLLLAAPPTAAESAGTTVAPEAEAPAAAFAQRQTTEAPGETGRDDASDVENDLRRDFNDLRRELLDHRVKLVDWWLMATAIFLTLLGVGAVIAGYLGFKRFRKEARGNVNTAKEYAEEARKLVDKIREEYALAKGMNAKTAAAEPDKADEAVRSVQANPSASLIDRAISAAIRLQRQGNNREAIEKWRAVASVADGTDDELGVQAWFSIGYLHGEESRHQEAIDAYDEAIRLKPDMAEAYYNRGNAKDELGRDEETILDKAIAEEAIADYDEVIRLEPDDTDAYYNRAEVRFALGHEDEARQGYKRALTLARAAGNNETMADRVRRKIERHFGSEDS